ncbi:MAG TPA: ATP-dependent zinc metalloprotease FtsH [Solirubrobacteraceae bacterium]|jgi:cell division protease FtsH|nr:ATP-dependent zinc metalloprotease FtsH [Solirubrobacteraceae bacterium]
MADQDNPRRQPSRPPSGWLRPGGQSGNRLQPTRQPDNRQRPNGPPQGQGPNWRVTPPPGNRDTGSSMRGGSGPGGRGPRNQWVVLAVIIGVLLAINIAVENAALSPNRVRIPYSPTFLNQLKHNNVASVSSTSEAIQGTFRKAFSYHSNGSSSAPTKDFSTQIPSFATQRAFYDELLAKNVTINAQNPNQGASLLESLLFGFGPTLLFVLVFFMIMRRAAAGGGAGGLMSFGRSRARRVEGTDLPVTFADVAGIDEAKDELHEIVDFLKSPDKYLALGAKIPRGVLLSGPPGTGKTLLARAVAGEAGVPFFQMSASEFVEMIVGVGASRVRDLFAQAKEAAPAIIFVDELDAVGRSRSSAGPNIGGGHDEREQTLNQILTEMDGFDARTGVIVLGATNRPEILDQALLRPGRFDRRVVVQPPDRVGREAILKVHTRSVPLGPEIDLGQIASTTPGMVGADLANLVNEAALLAAKRTHPVVNQQDFTDALERIVLGAARSVVISADDRRRTAYHEAGHAIVGMMTPGADPVRKVSIIPRGQALGVTFSAPDADRFNLDERHLHAQIKVALGGRSAEEVVFGDLTTGAESDIQHLTRIARFMVGRWGMSTAIGPVAVLPSEGSSMLLPGVSETSEKTQQLVDEEVHRIVEVAHREVLALLREHRPQLDDLVNALLAHETLDMADAYAAVGLPKPERAEETPPDAPPLATAID